VRTAAFWIQRTEVTFGDWIEFLNALPPASVQGLFPSVQTNRGPLELRRDRGLWKLILQPSSIRYESRQGQPITYPERAVRQSQRWEQFPVSGISPRQAQTYASWQSERLGHRVRLCRESEWERAARGADGRSFTLGERVAADEANFDRTYGRRAGGFGPDEVGSHPKSDSPFGLADMQGNAIEMVLSDHDDAELLEKGGSWYHDIGFDGHLAARFTLEREARNLQLGFRLCADL
jgi:formylglycine-generating enzyme required for sulfatase activity